MTDRRRPQISLRKQPQQARSAEIVAAILQAAIQVLVAEGAHRFTSARVAEKAGVSVGSVYQYFPNKVAILFRLQTDEWQQTSELLRGILEDMETAPLERLRTLVHEFLRTEFEEAKFRLALNDAAPLYRDAVDGPKEEKPLHKIMQKFLLEVLPGVSDASRALTGDVIVTTLTTVGEHLSRMERSKMEIEAYGNAIADMFCAHLTNIQRRS